MTETEQVGHLFCEMVLDLEKAMWDNLIAENDVAFREVLFAIVAVYNGVASDTILIGDNDLEGTLEWLNDLIESGKRAAA